jgi:hypothetical protein
MKADSIWNTIISFLVEYKGYVYIHAVKVKAAKREAASDERDERIEEGAWKASRMA